MKSILRHEVCLESLAFRGSWAPGGQLFDLNAGGQLLDFNKPQSCLRTLIFYCMSTFDIKAGWMPLSACHHMECPSPLTRHLFGDSHILSDKTSIWGFLSLLISIWGFKYSSDKTSIWGFPYPLWQDIYLGIPYPLLKEILDSAHLFSDKNFNWDVHLLNKNTINKPL